MDLLLPRTDTGVAVQAALVAMSAGGGLWWTRHHPELRILVMGTAITLLALIGVRAIH